MRCVDVIRELSAPTAQTKRSAVAGHLAECPQCAAWAERDARLGRLWDATRPEDPSAEAWEPVWRQMCDTLDRAPADVLPMRRPAAARRAWFVVLGVAQAAAVLFAVFYFTQSQTALVPKMAQNGPVISPQPAPPPVPSKFDVPQGETVVIRKDGDRLEATELAMNGDSIQVDPGFVALNSLEAIAQ